MRPLCPHARDLWPLGRMPPRLKTTAVNISKAKWTHWSTWRAWIPREFEEATSGVLKWTSRVLESSARPWPRLALPEFKLRKASLLTPHTVAHRAYFHSLLLVDRFRMEISLFSKTHVLKRVYKFRNSKCRSLLQRQWTEGKAFQTTLFPAYLILFGSF